MPFTQGGGSCPTTGDPTGSGPRWVLCFRPPGLRLGTGAPASAGVSVLTRRTCRDPAALRLWSPETSPSEVALGHGYSADYGEADNRSRQRPRCEPKGFKTEIEAGTVPSHSDLGGIFAPIGMDTMTARGRGQHSSRHLQGVPGYLFTASGSRSFHRFRRRGASGPCRSPDSSQAHFTQNQTK